VLKPGGPRNVTLPCRNRPQASRWSRRAATAASPAPAISAPPPMARRTHTPPLSLARFGRLRGRGPGGALCRPGSGHARRARGLGRSPDADVERERVLHGLVGGRSVDRDEVVARAAKVLHGVGVLERLVEPQSRLQRGHLAAASDREHLARIDQRLAQRREQLEHGQLARSARARGCFLQLCACAQSLAPPQTDPVVERLPVADGVAVAARREDGRGVERAGAHHRLRRGSRVDRRRPQQDRQEREPPNHCLHAFGGRGGRRGRTRAGQVPSRSRPSHWR